MIETRKDGIKFQNTKLEILNEDYVKEQNNYEQEQKSAIAEVLETASKLIIDLLQPRNRDFI